jgi:hypothetical protein
LVADDAVIQQSIMHQLSQPYKHDLRMLQDWLDRPTMGNLALIGADRDTWGGIDKPIDPNSDLLTPKLRQESDAFSRWLAEKFVTWVYHIFWYRVKKPQDLEAGITSYRDNITQRYASYITTTVASLLPILAIIILHCVDPMNTRLGLIALFTIAFTISLTIFTNAKRGEIFTAAST